MAVQQAPTFEKGKLSNLPIITIKPDPSQPRKYLDTQALDGEEKTCLTDEINQLSQELEARLNEINCPVAATPIGLTVGQAENEKRGTLSSVR